MTQQITITDEQAEIIGREIGKAFAKAFWTQVNSANKNRFTQMPGAFFIDRLGAAIGQNVEPQTRAASDAIEAGE